MGRRLRATMGWAVGLVAAVLLAAPAGAQAPLPVSEALSANVQTLVNNNWLSGPYLGVAAANGWRGARGDAFWFDAEPTAGTYDWTKFDRIKSAMDAAGERWMPILHGSPAWARDGGNQLEPPAERAYPDYARFAAAFVARYGPGGPMGGAWPVTDVEIGNEQNVLWARGAASYAELYAQAHGAIKAVNPGVRVIVGAVLYDSVPPTDADWIRAFFGALAGRGADAIGIHPYAPTAIGVMANIRRMQQGLVDAGQGALPLYVNELGYPAALDGAVPKQHAVDGPVTDQARAGTTSLITDALLASDCGVRNIAYFDLVSQENNLADTDYLSSETWKGLERRADASLTVTGAAYRDAGARWVAHPVPGTVHVCGGVAGPATTPLPLSLQIDRPSPTCFRPLVTYRGFPIEEATVLVRSEDGGKASPLLTDATGRLSQDFCVEPHATFVLQAQEVYAPAAVPVFAQSVAYSCPPDTTAACTPVAGTGPGGTAITSTGGSVVKVSGSARCLVGGLKVYGSRKLSTVLRRGLRLRSGSCRKAGAARAARRLTISATIDRRLARRLHVTKKLSKKPVRVASARRTVKTAGPVRVTLKFTKTARKRLAHVKKLTLRVAVTVTEGKAHKTVARKVVLKR